MTCSSSACWSRPTGCAPRGWAKNSPQCETTVADLPDYREMMVTVGNNSTNRLRKQVYSVPSRLIGSKLVARVYENRIVLLNGADEVAQLPLGKSDRGAVIDFRHLIGHLLRKPGAFANYRWREELFPAPVYRAAYDHLERSAPSKPTAVISNSSNWPPKKDRPRWKTRWNIC